MKDETHVIFHCPLFTDIHHKYEELLNRCNNIGLILNPEFNDRLDVANLLQDIDKVLDKR